MMNVLVFWAFLLPSLITGSSTHLTNAEVSTIDVSADSLTHYFTASSSSIENPVFLRLSVDSNVRSVDLYAAGDECEEASEACNQWTSSFRMLNTDVCGMYVMGYIDYKITIVFSLSNSATEATTELSATTIEEDPVELTSNSWRNGSVNTFEMEFYMFVVPTNINIPVLSFEVTPYDDRDVDLYVSSEHVYPIRCSPANREDCERDGNHRYYEHFSQKVTGQKDYVYITHDVQPLYYLAVYGVSNSNSGFSIWAIVEEMVVTETYAGFFTQDWIARKEYHFFEYLADRDGVLKLDALVESDGGDVDLFLSETYNQPYQLDNDAFAIEPGNDELEYEIVSGRTYYFSVYGSHTAETEYQIFVQVVSNTCVQRETCSECVGDGEDLHCGWCGSSADSGNCLDEDPESSGPVGGFCNPDWWHPDSCPAEYICHEYIECGECVDTRGCGWCGVTRTGGMCVPGTEEAPTTGLCAYWHAGSTPCPGTCVQHVDCMTCTSDDDCGWCNDDTFGGKCVDGHAGGPDAPVCDADEYYYETDRCEDLNPAQCTTLEVCEDCSLNPSCGWCGNRATSGMCLPGASAGPYSGYDCMEAWHHQTCPVASSLSRYFHAAVIYPHEIRYHHLTVDDVDSSIVVIAYPMNVNQAVGLYGALNMLPVPPTNSRRDLAVETLDVTPTEGDEGESIREGMPVAFNVGTCDLSSIGTYYFGVVGYPSSLDVGYEIAGVAHNADLKKDSTSGSTRAMNLCCGAWVHVFKDFETVSDLQYRTLHVTVKLTTVEVFNEAEGGLVYIYLREDDCSTDESYDKRKVASVLGKVNSATEVDLSISVSSSSSRVYVSVRADSDNIVQTNVDYSVKEDDRRYMAVVWGLVFGISITVIGAFTYLMWKRWRTRWTTPVEAFVAEPVEMSVLEESGEPHTFTVTQPVSVEPGRTRPAFVADVVSSGPEGSSGAGDMEMVYKHSTGSGRNAWTTGSSGG
eukprot:Rmarinus@m.21189